MADAISAPASPPWATRPSYHPAVASLPSDFVMAAWMAGCTIRQRDVIARGVFTSVADLGRQFRKYIRAYSMLAKPFRWACTDPSRRIGSTSGTK